WNIMEGTSCYNSTTCDQVGLIPPIWEYGRNEGGSVTGGYVYRGSLVPELFGLYINADYISGRIWTLEYEESTAPVNRLLLDTNLFISSFGTDAQNELYLCAFDGTIYSFRSAETDVSEKPLMPPQTVYLGYNYPNPFNPSTQIPFTISQTEHVALHIYDMQGKLIRTLVNGILQPGEHLVTFEAIDEAGLSLPSGVYFYQLKAGDFVAKKRLLLMR
ncbi:T9SS type A sorting domain-containing protein, partial [candidate division KSB1 bacterium]|nr:T9SS type A sorting domain-containing protein [candidate division KSB1 bacterium]